ncbi:3,5-dihydroxyphenylacetyl-CoA synthase DpgA [Streptomyces sp. NPDC007901]|uniref:3,5-dihydroxyphenylacetyl-CoA synthase DpgA n=1 Tax=Streptomyces sp. NPDC007901 TaxID=3364785 RepID=UPI0036ED3B2B
MTIQTSLPDPNLVPSWPPVPEPARIAGLGTAVTDHSYSQSDVLDIFGITDPKIRSVFANSAIERRFLSLPPTGADGTPLPEDQEDLLAKHKRNAVDMGIRALRACLADIGAEPADVEHLCCVTSTGFLTPGLSAYIIRDTGMDPRCSRADIVGMGCNAGLNALGPTASWAVANPGRLAVLICSEACSAAYTMDATMRTAVVNSLFGDGAAAIAVIAGDAARTRSTQAARDGSYDTSAALRPRILGFSSYIVTEAIEAMRFDWDSDQNRLSFFLDRDIPYVVGAHAERVVDRLLSDAGLRRSDVRHWLVHSGGKKVIDAVRVNLGLTRHDLRHTTGVLRDYGNLSSGSFLFSLQRLHTEGAVRRSDIGVLMTMGPGSTIETALVQW